MSRPARIQLSRRKGWRKPAGAVVVARPTIWGNPFSVAEYGRELSVALYRGWILGGDDAGIWAATRALIGDDEELLERVDRDAELALERLGRRAKGRGQLSLNGIGRPDFAGPTKALAREFLRGRDLACWCPLECACHADVLLELANGWESEP